MAVKILGEPLVLYRDRKGGYGLIEPQCPHRRMSLLYGVPEERGLRCAYHGWLFDEAGQCLEQPYEETEEPESKFKNKIRIKAYPVEELGGLLFAYLGPKPAPLLPRWEIFVRADARRDIGMAVIPCNWLQIMENSVDPVHVEWLHQHFNNYARERLGSEQRNERLKHEKIGFDLFEYGIVKRRILEGETETDEDWAVGHPLVFPNVLLSGSTRRSTFQIRVPVDDVHTLHVWYTCYAQSGGAQAQDQDRISFYRVPVSTGHGEAEPEWSFLDNNSGQDIAAWVTQGAIADRSNENLGLSDKGIILYRRLLKEQIAKMERGEDPMNVFRDPAKNVCIPLKLEEAKLKRSVLQPESRRQGGATKYSPVLNEEDVKSP
jgi:5,5'-dehydrodivanillate O-demethylase